jgi:hypothetical protein
MDTTIPEERVEMAAHIYNQVMLEMCRHRSWLYSPRITPALREKQRGKLLRMIEITDELGVSIEIYVRVQISALRQIMLAMGKSMFVPNIGHMISDKAKQRFTNEADRFEKDNKGQGLSAKLQGTAAIHISESVTASAKKFYLRLAKAKQMNELTEVVVLKELDMLVRAGALSYFYVLVHPLLEKTSVFVQERAKEALTADLTAITEAFDAADAMKQNRPEMFRDEDVVCYVI